MTKELKNAAQNVMIVANENPNQSHLEHANRAREKGADFEEI